MDILSTKGQSTLVHVKSAIDIFERNYKSIKIITTDDKSPAAFDFIFYKNDKVIGAAEFKCRNMSLEELQLRFENRWLITFDKIEQGRIFSRLTHIPFVGLLYLIEDKKLLIKKITDEKANIIAKMSLDYTETQRSINGGTAMRTNAYIDMNDAIIIK